MTIRLANSDCGGWNQLCTPVRSAIERQLVAAEQAGAKVVVLDVPLLFESAGRSGVTRFGLSTRRWRRAAGRSRTRLDLEQLAARGKRNS